MFPFLPINDMFFQAESNLKALTPTWGSWSMASLDQWWVSSDEVSICQHLWGKTIINTISDSSVKMFHKHRRSTSAVKVLSLPRNLQKLTLIIRLVYASKLMLNSSVVLQLSWTNQINPLAEFGVCWMESSVDPALNLIDLQCKRHSCILWRQSSEWQLNEWQEQKDEEQSKRSWEFRSRRKTLFSLIYQPNLLFGEVSPVMSIGDPQMRCSTQYHLSRLKCSFPPFSIRVVLLTQLCCDVAQKEAGLSALCKLTRETTGFLPRTLPLSYFLLRVCLLSSLPPACGIHRSTSNSLAAFLPLTSLFQSFPYLCIMTHSFPPSFPSTCTSVLAAIIILEHRI